VTSRPSLERDGQDPRETGPLVKTVDAVRAVLEETETTVRFLPCK